MNTSADRPRSKSLSPLRALLPFIKPYIHRPFLAASPSKNLVSIGFHGVGFAALRFYLVTWLGERVVADCVAPSTGAWCAWTRLFYETTRVGEVLSRLTTDTTLVQAISGVNLSIILRSSMSLVGALVMLGLTSAKLMGIILVILIPVVVAPLIIIGRRVRGLSRASQDRIADTSTGGRDVECHPDGAGLHLEDLQSDRYAQGQSKTASRPPLRRTRVRAWLTAVGIALVFAGITFVLWLGAHQVVAGTMTGGQLAAVPAVCRLRRQFGRRAHRNVGRNAARGRRHGAPERVAAARNPSSWRRRIP
jgi:ABC-type multidrug transport system fused ATPase/permease subunit